MLQTITTKQESFDNQATQYNCGYHSVCEEHICPCNISITYGGSYSKVLEKRVFKEAMLRATGIHCRD